MGKNAWEVFQEEEGIHYYFFEQNCKENFYRVCHNPFTEEEKSKISLDNLEGIFISKGPLFDNSGKYIGKPFFSFISDMQSFARDNNGEFVHFHSLVMDYYFTKMQEQSN